MAWKDQISRDGVLAVVISLLMIAGGVYWFSTFGPQSSEPFEPPAEQQFVRVEEIPELSSNATEDEVETALLEAFQQGALKEVERYPIPDSKGEALILAAPIMNDPEEVIQCSIQRHQYCGLYRVSGEGTTLLLWGNRLAGFAGVESFDSNRTAVIATSWTLMNYTTVERHRLDLQNGALFPLLLIEQDLGYDFAELQIRGSGHLLSLWIDGQYENGRIIPEKIVLRDPENPTEVYQRMDEETIRQIGSMVRAAEEKIDPLFLLPSDQDLEREGFSILLYGQPYDLDLTQRQLTPLEP
ncbi:hypothetical protein GF380_00315 [Candidatus Uhrbacteria bacterium]|nr:hypothetical protein [Candidatus Uhrbacteria bacterium]MBD3283861.1 hypothetical protein [Candidatus Uhrbacteria bacterium]